MAKNLSDLQHTRVDLPRRGEVIILDTGAIIDAEATAMLQALHSRSTGGLDHHLGILTSRGTDNFMKNFYVGYGHKSIGDCGTTTAFIEGVSMLAAKAIQDTPLYSGQEASTRYIDFSQQHFIDPTKSDDGHTLLEMQRAFYIFSQEPTRKHLQQQHLQSEKEKNATYKKAIKARGFDITRSLLPAGASTNLAWHTNLRQAADRMLFLRHHPLEEVRDIANGLEKALQTRHPHSFGHKTYEKTEEYQKNIRREYFYHDPDSPREPRINFSSIDREELERFKSLLSERPPKTELPTYVSQAGVISVAFQLDFGSFRDIQRHRALNQRMPLLTGNLGFNPWYTENFPEKVKERLPEHLGEIRRLVEALNISPTDTQYFLPMGFNISNKFTGTIPAIVYMVELRDSRFVHPTLQRVAHTIGVKITKELQIPLHVDPEPNRFDIKRGEHDITLKN